ncbi:MAG: DUF2442 domain-containing protein [Ignavibacteria bacterium]|nr:DUF2442 domain-containing protein [Ignavibacteria bacterium]
MIHLIKNIKSVEPYKIKLEFNNGETRVVDLKDKLIEWSQTPESKFKKLLDSEYFKTVGLNKELETIYWDNGIDLCPDVLYSMSNKS